MNTVMIIASGGIAQALANQLALTCDVIIVSRSEPLCQHEAFIPLDIDDKDCLDLMVKTIVERQVSCVIDTIGVLHDKKHMPEKSLCELDIDWFMKSMRINCLFTAHLLSRLTKALPKKSHLIFVALSARVGSISDNRLGGWISYRTSKAALNMVIKTTAAEWRRRLPNSIVIAYHPGTVRTRLSTPFLSQAKTIFTPEMAADYLIQFIPTLTLDMSGLFYDWKKTLVSP